MNGVSGTYPGRIKADLGGSNVGEPPTRWPLASASC